MDILKLEESALVKILEDPQAPVFDKNVACRRLALIGTKACVPALAAMLGDAKLAHYARFGLGPIPDPAVDEALRAQLPKLKARLLVGVINTIGQRKDEKAIVPLAKLIRDANPEVSEAAAEAIGKIGGQTAANALREALAKTKGATRVAVADAALVCAESLDKAEAIGLYDLLSRLDMPKNVRMAALHSAFAAEMSR